MHISLCGQWSLRKTDSDKFYTANVPGDVFSDLKANGVIPDPLVGLNEQKVQWVGKQDWEYSRAFNVDARSLEYQFVELTFNMLDTLAEVFVNDAPVAKVKNINRRYVWDVKALLRAGENTVKIIFRSPLAYIAQKHKAHPLPNSTLGEAGSCHIRKSPYHFGWDWGPHLLTCGIADECFLNCYDVCKITRLDIKQTHADNFVDVDVRTYLSATVDGLKVAYTLSLDGKEVCSASGENATLRVENPQLWQCNGLGAQPLYELSVKVFQGDKLLARKDQKIGLRTIVLNANVDEIGRDFCFYLNGRKIFARGANWIPADSFINNVSDEKLYDLLFKAKACNMNMIRVWGGGYYESDRFYDLCDRLGLLVWQDFNFACSPYPFDDKEFLDEVFAEIEDNVLRLKNHACLCLWAGNNEIESMSMAWLNRKKVIRDCGEFFYKTLPQFLARLDENTPYWACTPSSGTYMKNINSCDKGDTHLWHVWHGLRKLDYYQSVPTRFCSEFGIESLPSLNAIEKFCDGYEYSSVDCDLAKAHQKCIGGNGKIKYYTLSKFWTPARFEDTVYLSQLTQALCVKNATDGWRINPRCHGALYWQYNDCWGVNSWSGMDYYGNMKALQYCAKRFNQNAVLVLQKRKANLNVLFVNDGVATLPAKVNCGVATYDGKILYTHSDTLTIDCESTQLVTSLNLKTILKKYKTSACYVYAQAYDSDGNLICQETLPLTDENKAKLPKAHLAYELSLSTDTDTQQANLSNSNALAKDNCNAQNNTNTDSLSTETQGNTYERTLQNNPTDTVTLTLTSTAYARFVEIRLVGYSAMLSDNYFDLLPAQEKRISFPLPQGETLESIKSKITIRSLCDVERKYSPLRDKLTKIAIFLHPVNLANYIARTFDK